MHKWPRKWNLLGFTIFLYSWKNQTTKLGLSKKEIKIYNEKKNVNPKKEGVSNQKSSTKNDEWWYSELPLKSSLSLFVSNSSVISVSSSSAAENRKLGRPREGDELEGELFLRRSLFEKKERFWVINRKTGRNKTIKFKTLSKMHKIEFWLMKS